MGAAMVAPGHEPHGAASTFRRMHASGCFLLPNPWDAGSAVALWRLGFQALATTSAGVAFAHGRPDAIPALPLDEMLAHVRDLATATPLPLNVDFQSGYSETAEGVAANVRRCVEAGAAGLSIEDASGEPAAPLLELERAVERVGAARAAIDSVDPRVVLTARCEAFLAGDPDPLRTALDRLVRFAEAGADCLFAPGVRSPDAIESIVKAVAPRPVNVLVSAPVPGLTLARLAELGVRRVSVGSALARVAWGAFLRASRSLLETGTFDHLASAAPFAELDAMFAHRAAEP